MENVSQEVTRRCRIKGLHVAAVSICFSQQIPRRRKYVELKSGDGDFVRLKKGEIITFVATDKQCLEGDIIIRPYGNIVKIIASV